MIEITGVEIKIEFDSKEAASSFRESYKYVSGNMDISNYYITEFLGNKVWVLFYTDEQEKAVNDATKLKSRFDKQVKNYEDN